MERWQAVLAQKHELYRPMGSDQIEIHWWAYEQIKQELSEKMRKKREDFYNSID